MNQTLKFAELLYIYIVEVLRQYKLSLLNSWVVLGPLTLWNVPLVSMLSYAAKCSGG